MSAPAGMREVSRDEFFGHLYADKRDIMPTVEAREYTYWRVVSTRRVWGWSAPGWGNPQAPKCYALADAAAGVAV